MKILITSTIAALALLSSTITVADDKAFSACRQHFYNGTSPTNINESLKPRPLCFDGYATSHSATSKTPIFSAERLTREIVAKEIERTDKFYEEARLPSSERATLDDYKGSGFDRGHMAPAADMATDEAMAQSFSLANMVPQAPNNNRKTWSKVEGDVRKYIMRAQGDVYVITGPVFSAKPETIGQKQVWIPSQIYKVVFDPKAGKKWAYWVDNTDSAKAEIISYEELVKRTGIQFF